VNAAVITADYRKPLRCAIDQVSARHTAQEADSVGHKPDEADETFRAEREGFSAAVQRELSQCSDFHWYG
jgi:hypothetical protein